MNTRFFLVLLAALCGFSVSAQTTNQIRASALPSTNAITHSNSFIVTVFPNQTNGTMQINASNLLNSLIALPNWPSGASATNATIYIGGVKVTNANLNATLPAASHGGINAYVNLDGTNVSIEIPLNSVSSAGVVSAGVLNPNKMWGTDALGNPGWMNPGGGVTSIDGITNAAHLLSLGTNGTVPYWTTNATTGDHTLNIPWAGSANSGLLDTRDWSAFYSRATSNGVNDAITGLSNNLISYVSDIDFVFNSQQFTTDSTNISIKSATRITNMLYYGGLRLYETNATLGGRYLAWYGNGAADGGGWFHMGDDGAATGFRFYKTIEPSATNSFDLGSTDLPWNSVIADDLTARGAFTLQGTNILLVSSNIAVGYANGLTNNSILRTNSVTAAGSGIVVRQDGAGGITLSNAASSGSFDSNAFLNVANSASIASNLTVGGTINTSNLVAQLLSIQGPVAFGYKTNTSGAVVLATNAVQFFETNDSFAISFTGTPELGQVVSLTVSNSSASTINATNPATVYSIQWGSNSPVVGCPPGVKTKFAFEWNGSTWDMAAGSTNTLSGASGVSEAYVLTASNNVRLVAGLASTNAIDFSSNAVRLVAGLSSTNLVADATNAVTTNILGGPNTFTGTNTFNLAVRAPQYTFTFTASAAGTNDAAVTNLLMNLDIGTADVILTNNASLTNISGFEAGKNKNMLLVVRPVGTDRTITWPTGNMHGYRWLTNANNALPTVFTNGSVYAVSATAVGTNIMATATKWD